MANSETTSQHLQQELDDIRQIDQILHEDSDADGYLGSDLEIDEGDSEDFFVTDENVPDQFSPRRPLSSISSSFGDAPGATVEDEFESDTDPDVCKEELLLLNHQYQNFIVTNIRKVQEALEKNRKLQETRVSSKKKDAPVIHHRKFLPPYFKDVFNLTAPDNEDTVAIRQVGYPLPTDPQYPRPWSKQERTALQCGVKADGLERRMTPLLNHREVLEKRLKDAVNKTDKVNARKLKKEIAETDKKLSGLKVHPLEDLLGSVDQEIDWPKVASRHLEGTRTEAECKAQWQVSAHPSFKHTWSVAEEKKLKEIVKKHNSRDWNAIAAKLGTGHSAFQCIQKYQQKLNTSLYKRDYTAEEDEQILELIEKFRIGNCIPWSKVCYFLKDRKVALIAWRWESKLDPSLRFGKWQPWEDKILAKAVEKQGNDVVWVRVARDIEGRSQSQCRTRWLNSLNPEIRRGRFSAAEDLIILEGVKKCGTGRWSKIAHAVQNHPQLAPGRNASMIMWRFRYLAQHFLDDERRSFNRNKRAEKKKILEEEMVSVVGGCQTDLKGLLQGQSYQDYLSGLNVLSFLDRMIALARRKVEELGDTADKANVSELTGHTYWLPFIAKPTMIEGSGEQSICEDFIEDSMGGIPLPRYRNVTSYIKEDTEKLTSHQSQRNIDTLLVKELFPQRTLKSDLFFYKGSRPMLKLRRCHIVRTEFNKKKSLSWSTTISVIMLATKVNFTTCRGIINRNAKLSWVHFPYHTKPQKLKKRRKPRRSRKSHPYQLVLNNPKNPGVGEIVSGNMIGRIPVVPKTREMNFTDKQTQLRCQSTDANTNKPSESVYVMKTSDGRILLVSTQQSQPQNASEIIAERHMKDTNSTQVDVSQMDTIQQGILSNNIMTKGVGETTSQVRYSGMNMSSSSAFNQRPSANLVQNSNVPRSRVMESSTPIIGSGIIFQTKFKPYSSGRRSKTSGQSIARVTRIPSQVNTTATLGVGLVKQTDGCPPHQKSSPGSSNIDYADDRVTTAAQQSNQHAKQTLISGGKTVSIPVPRNGASGTCSDGMHCGTDDEDNEKEENVAQDHRSEENAVGSKQAMEAQLVALNEMVGNETQSCIDGEGVGVHKEEKMGPTSQGNHGVFLPVAEHRDDSKWICPDGSHCGTDDGDSGGESAAKASKSNGKECSQSKGNGVEREAADTNVAKDKTSKEGGDITCGTTTRSIRPCSDGIHCGTDDEDGQEKLANVSKENKSKKRTKGGRQRKGEENLVLPFQPLARTRRKAAPKPGSFRISSTDESEESNSDDGSISKKFKPCVEGAVSITTDKTAGNLSKTCPLGRLPGIPPTHPSLAGLSPDTKVLVGAGGYIVGILPAQYQDNRSTVFPTVNPFTNIVLPRTSPNVNLSIQVPHRPINPVLPPALSMLTTPRLNTFLPRSVVSLPNNQVSLSNSTCTSVACSTVSNNMTPFNKIVQETTSTNAAPRYGSPKQTVKQLLNTSAAASCPRGLNINAPQTIVVIPSTTSKNLIGQQLVNPIMNHIQGLATGLAPNVRFLSNQVVQQPQSNLLMPSLIQTTATIPSGQTGRTIMPNVAPSSITTSNQLMNAMMVPNSPAILQPNLTSNIPLITSSPNVLPQSSAIPGVTSIVTSVTNSSNLDLPVTFGRQQSPKKISKTSANANQVYIQPKGTEISQPGITSTMVDSNALENPSSKSTKPGLLSSDAVHLDMINPDKAKTKITAGTVREMIQSKKREEALMTSKAGNDLQAGTDQEMIQSKKREEVRQPFLSELLKDDQVTIDLEKLEEFTASSLGSKDSSRRIAILPPNLSTLFSFKHLLLKKASLEKSTESFSMSNDQLQNLMKNVNINSVAYRKYHTKNMEDIISAKDFLLSMHNLQSYRLFQERFIAYFLWPAFLSLLNPYPPARPYHYMEPVKKSPRNRKRGNRNRRKNVHGKTKTVGGISGGDERLPPDNQENEKAMEKTGKKGQKSPKGKRKRVRLSVQPLRRGTRKTPLRKPLPSNDVITVQDVTGNEKLT